MIRPEQPGEASIAKDAVSKPDGLTRNERWQFSRMAAHQEIVEEVIARSTDKAPASRRAVMAAIDVAEGREPRADKPIRRAAKHLLEALDGVDSVPADTMQILEAVKAELATLRIRGE